MDGDQFPPDTTKGFTTNWKGKIATKIIDDCFERLGSTYLKAYLNAIFRSLGKQEAKIAARDWIQSGYLWFFASRGIMNVDIMKDMALQSKCDLFLQDEDLGGHRDWNFEDIMLIRADGSSIIFDDPHVEETARKWIDTIACVAESKKESEYPGYIDPGVEP